MFFATATPLSVMACSIARGGQRQGTGLVGGTDEQHVGVLVGAEALVGQRPRVKPRARADGPR